MPDDPPLEAKHSSMTPRVFTPRFKGLITFAMPHTGTRARSSYHAASINTVKWEPSPIREPHLLLTLYPLLFI